MCRYVHIVVALAFGFSFIGVAGDLADKRSWNDEMSTLAKDSGTDETTKKEVIEELKEYDPEQCNFVFRTAIGFSDAMSDRAASAAMVCAFVSTTFGLGWSDTSNCINAIVQGINGYAILGGLAKKAICGSDGSQMMRDLPDFNWSNKNKRHFISLACLVASNGCSLAGFASGNPLLTGVGVCFSMATVYFSIPEDMDWVDAMLRHLERLYKRKGEKDKRALVKRMLQNHRARRAKVLDP
ncbi:MAG TPA: hypothetical protein VEL47_00920 [Myxococcota bacterium]|nr:hypothetical protein [Myxococcota bacterium]